MDFGPLLSGASLLATVSAILYSLWYPEITAALSIPPKLKRADRTKQILIVRSALWTRAAPLSILTLAQILVLAPSVIPVVAGTLDTLIHSSPVPATYDSLAAAFVLAWLIILVLTVLAMRLSGRLYTFLRQLELPD